MRVLIIFSIILVILFGCKKVETSKEPIISEENIRFTTNLDTGTYNVADTLPLSILVWSKIPSNGIVYSIVATLSDISKQILKIDTISSQSTLELKLPGFKQVGNYSINVKLTSNSTLANSSNKSIKIINEPLSRFTGYKIDPISLARSRQKDFGIKYWNSTAVMLDLAVLAFQKPHSARDKYGTFLSALGAGDFNDDGYIDVFNGGANSNGITAEIAFLVWDQKLKKFQETNLFNDGRKTLTGPVKIISLYLNNDNYTDMVIIGHGDEGIVPAENQPIFLAISDGKGKYDIKTVSIPEYYRRFTIEGGDVGDLNGDGIPDIFAVCNSHSFIFWGLKSDPYFNINNPPHFASDTANFESNNGFGEIFPQGAGDAYMTHISDMNMDGKEDIIIASYDQTPHGNRILINKGNGRFNSSSLIKLSPFNIKDSAYGTTDYLTDDINNDGLKDIITVNQKHREGWNIYFYFQQNDGSYRVDNSSIVYNIRVKRAMQWIPKLLYYDYNNDGLKDIGYIDSADNGEFKTKSVFIRSGNKFIETDFYQVDPYMNSIKSLIKE